MEPEVATSGEVCDHCGEVDGVHQALPDPPLQHPNGDVLHQGMH